MDGSLIVAVSELQGGGVEEDCGGVGEVGVGFARGMVEMTRSRERVIGRRDDSDGGC